MWVVSPEFDGLLERYEAAVDAHSGELLSFQDRTATRPPATSGRRLPVSNDGMPPDGVEVPAYPMPYADVTHGGGTTTSDSGGNVLGVSGDHDDGAVGPFMRMNDNCGAIVETSPADDLDLGTSGGTDCEVPPGAPPATPTLRAPASSSSTGSSRWRSASGRTLARPPTPGCRVSSPPT